MPDISDVSAAPANNQTLGAANGINELDLDDFLNLMIAELQNQDPLNPLENSEMLAQIAQIRAVGASDKLTETLDSVLLGQNLSSATNLIGADIEAISDDNQRVTGVVNRVTVSGGVPKLHIDERPQVSLADEPGQVEKGSYQYRVVWSDEQGNQFAIDPLAVNGLAGGVIELAEGSKSVQISGLPETANGKSIYRTDSSGEGEFRFVGTLPDGKTSTFVDAKSDEQLSATVLNDGIPLINNLSRSFTISLRNVGEIRPPKD